MTRVRVLGSGTALPTERRASPGLVIEPRAGGAVLLDPGPGTLCRYAKQGGDLEGVTAVWLTHFHPDHTLDLMALLFARRNPWLAPRLRPLRLVGPAGTRALVERMVHLYGAWVRPDPGELAVVEVGEGALPREAGLEGGAFAMDHGEGALGYRFSFPEGVLALSGDTGPCPAVAALGAKADLFFLECAVPEGFPAVEGHLRPSEAGRIAAEARAKRVVLYHLYPPVEAAEAAAVVRRVFGGEVRVAEDGDRFIL